LKQVIFFFPTDFVAFLDQKVGKCWENFGKSCFPSESLTNFAEFLEKKFQFFCYDKTEIKILMEI
jgi:hypothetical protein